MILQLLVTFQQYSFEKTFDNYNIVVCAFIELWRGLTLRLQGSHLEPLRKPPFLLFWFTLSNIQWTQIFGLSFIDKAKNQKVYFQLQK